MLQSLSIINDRSIRARPAPPPRPGRPIVSKAGTAAFLLLLLISLQFTLPSGGLSNYGTGDDLAGLPGSEPFRPEFAGSMDQSKASAVPNGTLV